MTVYVALLRAVNVGGTGKLPMSELKAMCDALGFKNARTYIASGNVVFETPKTAAQVKTSLQKSLAAYAGKPVGVVVRTGEELSAVLARNPFAKAPGNRVVAIFLDDAPPKEALKAATGVKDEEMRLGLREIYVSYGSGMADSKLRISVAKDGTARNMNTIAKLAAMATEPR